MPEPTDREKVAQFAADLLKLDNLATREMLKHPEGSPMRAAWAGVSRSFVGVGSKLRLLQAEIEKGGN